MFSYRWECSKFSLVLFLFTCPAAVFKETFHAVGPLSHLYLFLDRLQGKLLLISGGPRQLPCEKEEQVIILIKIKRNDSSGATGSFSIL